MRKAYIKQSIIIVLFICVLFSFSGCLDVLGAIFGGYAPPYDDPSNYPEYPNYQSAYTEEEHVQKLTERTMEGLIWKKITGNYFGDTFGNNIKLSAVEVEIVYAFYDYDPEFFVMDLTFENKMGAGYGGELTNEGYLLGYILNDEYYLLQYDEGKNPWDAAGYQDYKKYFGSGYYAVKIDEKMTAFFRRYYSTNGFGTTRKEENIHEVLNANTEKDYMEYDYSADMMVKYAIKHVDYVSEHADRMHIVNISIKTDKLFKGRNYSALQYWGKMDLHTYTVEIMYSIYDNDPEYFLMQAQLETPIETSDGLTADKIWYIGIIQNDEYYIFDCGYGLNPYEASGFGESVKYHAFGHYAVQTGENELTEIIYDEETGVWEQRILTDAEKRIYGEYNDASDFKLYYQE